MVSGKPFAVVVGGTTLAFVLAGCGGGSTPSTSNRALSKSANDATAFDVVSGKVIAAGASTASVQGDTGPQSIAYSSTTRLTKTSSTTRSALATGDCVSVGSAGGSSNVTARTVTITSTSGCPTPVSRRNGTTGPVNGGAPRPFATGSPGFGGLQRGPGNTRFASRGIFGTVVAVGPSSFTVRSVFGSTSSRTTVKTTSSTAYAATTSATASDVVKGQCVNAVGTTDVSGVLEARSISISAPVKGGCPVSDAGLFVRNFGGPGPGVADGTGPGGTRPNGEVLNGLATGGA